MAELNSRCTDAWHRGPCNADKMYRPVQHNIKNKINSEEKLYSDRISERLSYKAVSVPLSFIEILPDHLKECSFIRTNVFFPFFSV